MHCSRTLFSLNLISDWCFSLPYRQGRTFCMEFAQYPSVYFLLVPWFLQLLLDGRQQQVFQWRPKSGRSNEEFLGLNQKWTIPNSISSGWPIGGRTQWRISEKTPGGRQRYREVSENDPPEAGTSGKFLKGDAEEAGPKRKSNWKKTIPNGKSCGVIQRRPDPIKNFSKEIRRALKGVSRWCYRRGCHQWKVSEGRHRRGST